MGFERVSRATSAPFDIRRSHPRAVCRRCRFGNRKALELLDLTAQSDPTATIAANDLKCAEGIEEKLDHCPPPGTVPPRSPMSQLG